MRTATRTTGLALPTWCVITSTNPVAIVNSMVAAIAEMRAAPNFSGWDELCADPALKLMTHQLAFLQGIQTCESLDDWSDWRKACEGE